MFYTVVAFMIPFFLMLALTRLIGGVVLSPISGIFAIAVAATAMGIEMIVIPPEVLDGMFMTNIIGVFAGNFIGSEWVYDELKKHFKHICRMK